MRMNRWDISDNTDDDYHNINLSSDDESLSGYQKIKNLFRKRKKTQDAHNCQDPFETNAIHLNYSK